MSEQGLEIIETTAEKTHEWIARIVESLHMEKCEARKSPGTVQNFLAVIANHVANGEMKKIMDAFSRDMRSLFSALASPA